MFINFSNHPSARWDQAQLDAAREYGEIVDIPFPEVSPFAGEHDITVLAEESVSNVLKYADKGDAVMAQGEFTLTYSVINILKRKGIKVLSACSTRSVEESTDENGNTIRKSVFSFARFREYT